MDKIHAILNNRTAAPAGKISELDEDHTLFQSLVEGTECEIQELAYQKLATRIHLYEENEDIYGHLHYNYIATSATAVC